ncbi:ribosomal protein L15 [Methanococcus vannielii SB]|jgi:large subunit ribosomal protein L18e|uniref:Large ribosomal subunit protein eL18 n=1 Tax=Methanococcus vannielii (strain ATCC 35089 / DSM 1224 / JCM 13029 / OCM 148 / SB) TaxID=406327 RepID=A6UPW8_METVS|nr:50S ribosomal protein L18e [Methanococcus vannielii]ABR54540.1 ribosomal protein L15 [Methanococcus vannielii SB]
MRKTMATNPKTTELIQTLKQESFKNSAPIWKDVAKKLSKPARKKIEVNVSKINRYASEGNVILVPGKVLGAGSLKTKVTVAAFSFSETAKSAIESVGGKCLSIEQIIAENPKGSKVIIMA